MFLKKLVIRKLLYREDIESTPVEINPTSFHTLLLQAYSIFKLKKAFHRKMLQVQKNTDS